MKRPTLKDIAAIAGVSHVAVSMALRNHPRISAETRERIKVIAQEIGYRPDPALSSLIVYRRGVAKSGYRATLAWVGFYRKSVKDLAFNRLLFQGARERCIELGYTLEEFYLADMGMSFSRLSKVLYAQNIQGVLFSPLERSVGHINMKAFAWEQFSVISFGFSLVSPKLDVVIDAQSRAARAVVRKLRSLGYRRIGFVIERGYNERTDGNLLAGYLGEQTRFPEARRIPPLILVSDNCEQTCREWFQRYEPDGVFDTRGILYNLLTPAELSRCGIAVHCGVAIPGFGEMIAGIDQNAPLIGQVGVNEVVSLINANVRGIPAIPRRILVEGTWINGKSAPQLAYK